MRLKSGKWTDPKCKGWKNRKSKFCKKTVFSEILSTFSVICKAFSQKVNKILFGFRSEIRCKMKKIFIFSMFFWLSRVKTVIKNVQIIENKKVLPCEIALKHVFIFSCVFTNLLWLVTENLYVLLFFNKLLKQFTTTTLWTKIDIISHLHLKAAVSVLFMFSKQSARYTRVPETVVD